MRLWILLLAVLPASPQGCEASPSTQKVLDQLEVPDDLRLPAAERQTQKMAVLQGALTRSRKDVFLHETYQHVRLAGLEINRESLIAEYEKLLAKSPRDPVFLYLAANAQVGHKTKDAIGNLERAIDIAPSFGLPHLLLAEIYSAKAYSNDVQVAQHADRFAEVCPGRVRSFTMPQWSKNHDLITRTAARIRKMGKALGELKVSVPSVAARDFAYSMLPTMAIPANWLITPLTTQMLTYDDRTLDQWLRVTTDAIEKGAKR